MTENKKFTVLGVFGGSDLSPFWNDVAIGEVQSIQYSDSMRKRISYDQERRIQGVIRCAVFNGEPTLMRAFHQKGAEHEGLFLKYVNEDGLYATEHFVNAVILERKAGRQVDDFLFYDDYYFEADDIIYETGYAPQEELTFEPEQPAPSANAEDEGALEEEPVSEEQPTIEEEPTDER